MSAPCDSAAWMVLRHAEDHPERAALIAPRGRNDVTVTYEQLAARTAAIAEGLRRRGVAAGDRVALLVPMSLELYATLLAISSLGAIAVFVEPASTLRQVADALRIARPKAFIAIPKAHVLRLLSRAVGAIPVQVLVGARAAAPGIGATSLAALERDGHGAEVQLAPVRPDSPALLTFSSGTTGAPKGALRTHQFLAAQHASFVRMFLRSAHRVDVDMSAFPIVLLSSLCSGSTAVIPRMGRGVSDIDGAELLGAIERYGVTVLSGSPAFVRPIVDAAAAARRPLGTVRRILSGGAPVPPSLCEAVDERTLPNGSMLVAYGSTEAEPIATIDAAEVRRETGRATRSGAGLCVGRPDDHLELRLLRPTRRPLEIGPEGIAGLTQSSPGAVGEVAVAGAHVNEHYYRNAAAERATKVVDERGVVWHRTGDAAYLDDQGRLWIVGRINDIVECAGKAFFPAAVEAVAQTVAAVERAALIEDGAGGTLLLVQAAGRLDQAALRTALARADIDVDRIRRTKRLPVDPRHQAKLDYKAIRKSFAATR